MKTRLDEINEKREELYRENRGFNNYLALLIAECNELHKQIEEKRDTMKVVRWQINQTEQERNRLLTEKLKLIREAEKK